MRVEKDGHTIRSLKDWEEHAGPKLKKQWKKGRSAYECAKAWLGHGEPKMPADLRDLLDSCERTRGLRVEVVHPELQIPFDDCGGEPRNADIAFVGLTGETKVAVTVEAKADEEFSKILSKQMASAEKAKQASSTSRQLERLHGLLKALFNLEPEALPEVETLRYQLLTATAGTLAYAQEEGADLAILIVHVFRTEETKDKKLTRNDDDYRAFVDRLRALSPDAGASGELEGPFRVPGGGRYDEPVELFVGKVVTNCRG